MQSTHSPIVSGPQRSFIQPGYHQNLSGSDTDVSTSTENLTAEEKRVLQNGVRQEPQGEETIIDDVDAISSNTLIIHDTKFAGEHDSPFYGQNCHHPNKNIDSCMKALEREKDNCNRIYSEYPENLKMHQNSRIYGLPNVPHSPKTALHKVMYSPVQNSPNHNSWEHYSPPREYTRKSVTTNPTTYSPSGSYHIMAPVNSFPESHTKQGITEIPKDYLDQSEILKYLAKELNHQNYVPENNNYPPLPEYPKQAVDSSKDHQMIFGSAARRKGLGIMNAKSKSAERLSVSRSHPDLSHGKLYHSEDNSAVTHQMQRPETHGRIAFPVDSEVAAIQANQMIELLSAENTALKTELDLYYKKVSKLQKFELEIQKVQKAYQDLVHSSEKRETLEKAIRARLEAEIRHLSAQNKELREYLESASPSPHITSRHPISEVNESELKKELSKREVLIAQLLTQTKELIAEKERQEIELQAQRATLQEQRNHIDILDNALTNAQANVVRLEEESRKKQVYVDRVAQLQKALTNLQQSSEKRLLMEKKLRAQMEKEVQALKSQRQGKVSASPDKKMEKSESIEGLRKSIMEYEEKIIGLEAEVSKWEQRYIEESTMRQIAVDAASVPKDAKIAALEKTSQESEKLIAQARTEKLKQMDELYAANRKCAELESKIKDFESKLAEKDAMIKVLQQHSQEKDVVLQHAVLGRPPRHTRAASTVGITTSTSHTTTTTGCSSLGRVSPSPTNSLLRKTASKPECSTSGSLLSISSSESSSATLPSQSSPVTESVTASKKSIDEQLKELDSRLSRLDHKRSASRERKISKSLLESMKIMICN